MFEPFYNFTHTPFSRDIPTDQLYMSPALVDILGRLKYAAERQWFAVVTGDCGTGKQRPSAVSPLCLSNRSSLSSMLDMMSIRAGSNYPVKFRTVC